jgi:hypothetical protein
MNRTPIDVVDPDMVEVLRAMTPARRLAIVDGMWTSARDMLVRLVRAEHPEWSAVEVERAVARRMSGDAARTA